MNKYSFQNLYVSADRARQDLMRVAANYEGGLKKWDIQPYELVYSAELLPGSRSYRFIMKETNQAGQTEDEVLLNINDSFHPLFMGIQIGRQDQANGIFVQNNPYYSAPDPLVFNGGQVAGAGATEKQSLEVVYNGFISMKTNKVDRLKPIKTSGFRYMPAYPTRSVETATGVFALLDPEYGITPEKQGLQYIGAPTINLAGQEDNILILDLPSTPNIANINGDTDPLGVAGRGNLNVLTIRLQGYLVVQGSQAITKGQILAA